MMVNNPLSRGLGQYNQSLLDTCSQSIRSKLKKHVSSCFFCVEMSICYDTGTRYIRLGLGVKARGGVEGSKMPNFDFSICYRAGKNEPNAKNGRLRHMLTFNIIFPSYTPLLA